MHIRCLDGPRGMSRSSLLAQIASLSSAVRTKVPPVIPHLCIINIVIRAQRVEFVCICISKPDKSAGWSRSCVQNWPWCSQEGKNLACRSPRLLAWGCLPLPVIWNTSIANASHDMDKVHSERKVQAFPGSLNLHVGG